MTGEKDRRELVEYNAYDYFIPLVSLRHLPKISRLENSVDRKNEFGNLVAVNFVNMAIYPLMYLNYFKL